MKRLTFVILAIWLLLSPVFAAELRFVSAQSVPLSVQNAVRKALQRSMLPRLDFEQVLFARLGEGYRLELEVDEKQLVLDLDPTISDLEHFIVSNLTYDGLALLASRPQRGLEFVTEKGFALSVEDESQMPVGSSWHVLDGNGRKRGTVIASYYRQGEPNLVLLQQLAGKQLLVGMGLVRAKELPLSVELSMDLNGLFGLSALASSRLGLYPFRVVYGLSSPELSSIYAVLGVQSYLPLSHVAGSSSHVVRNLGIEARVLLGGGTSFSQSGFLIYSEGSLGVVYHAGSWALSVEGGNRLIVSSEQVVHKGLFLRFATAYTYLP